MPPGWASTEIATHALGDSSAYKPDGTANDLSQNHHHEITDPLDQRLNLGCNRIAGFEQKCYLLLPPTQCA